MPTQQYDQDGPGELYLKSHEINGIRAENWSLSGSIMECVDNSIKHGSARQVAILIANKAGIRVHDDGNDVDDINRMFTKGDSSSYGNLGQIG
jgi:hypothetical protein